MASEDPFDAAKRDLEERDRMKMLADDARPILNKLEDWPDWPVDLVIRELLAIMSWGDARRVLDYIDWEDAQCH